MRYDSPYYIAVRSDFDLIQHYGSKYGWNDSSSYSSNSNTKKSLRQIMCLEESFCLFTRDALNFLQLKIYTAPRSSVQVSPLPQQSSLRRVTLCSIILLSYRSCSLEKQRINAPTRKVYLTLVYLLLFAVALLCCEISFTDLLSAMPCSHSLIMHVYLRFIYTESSFLLVSHWFTRCD